MCISVTEKTNIDSLPLISEMYKIMALNNIITVFFLHQAPVPSGPRCSLRRAGRCLKQVQDLGSKVSDRWEQDLTSLSSYPTGQPELTVSFSLGTLAFSCVLPDLFLC